MDITDIKISIYEKQMLGCISEDERDILLEYVNLITEKSHGKHKYDFRAAVDIKTGHPIKIVYSQEGMQLVLGDGRVLDNKHPDVYRMKRQHNTDHLSQSQKVLAIIDVITKKRLKSVDCVGLFGYDTGGTSTVSQNDPEEFVRMVKANPSKFKIFHVEEGLVEKTATYKSTFWPKDMKDANQRNMKSSIKKREIYNGSGLSSSRLNNLGSKKHPERDVDERSICRNITNIQSDLSEINKIIRKIDNELRLQKEILNDKNLTKKQRDSASNMVDLYNKELKHRERRREAIRRELAAAQSKLSEYRKKNKRKEIHT